MPQSHVGWRAPSQAMAGNHHRHPPRGDGELGSATNTRQTPQAGGKSLMEERAKRRRPRGASQAGGQQPALTHLLVPTLGFWGMSMVFSTESCFTARPRSAMAQLSFLFTRMFLDFRSRCAIAGLPVDRESTVGFGNDGTNCSIASEEARRGLVRRVTMPCKTHQILLHTMESSVKRHQSKRKILEGISFPAFREYNTRSETVTSPSERVWKTLR